MPRLTPLELREVCVLVDAACNHFYVYTSGLSTVDEYDLGNPAIHNAALRLVRHIQATEIGAPTYLRMACGVIYRKTKLPITLLTLASNCVHELVKAQFESKAFSSERDAEKLPVGKMIASTRLGGLDLAASVKLALETCDKLWPHSNLLITVLSLRGLLDPRLLIDLPALCVAWRRGRITVPHISYAAALEWHNKTKTAWNRLPVRLSNKWTRYKEADGN